MAQANINYIEFNFENQDNMSDENIFTAIGGGLALYAERYETKYKENFNVLPILDLLTFTDDQWVIDDDQETGYFSFFEDFKDFVLCLAKGVRNIFPEVKVSFFAVASSTNEFQEYQLEGKIYNGDILWKDAYCDEDDFPEEDYDEGDAPEWAELLNKRIEEKDFSLLN